MNADKNGNAEKFSETTIGVRFLGFRNIEDDATAEYRSRQLLSRALNVGRVVAFVGSGISYGFGHMDWEEFTEKIITFTTDTLDEEEQRISPETRQLLDYFKIEIQKKNECDLRVISVSNDKEQQKIVQKFQSEFESKQKECAVLIVSSTSAPDKWTIAGFDDEGQFTSLLINDPSSELAVELKKKSGSEAKILSLAISSLGRTEKTGYTSGIARPDRMLRCARSMCRNIRKIFGPEKIKKKLAACFKSDSINPKHVSGIDSIKKITDKLNIKRFVTTNYDLAIERSIENLSSDNKITFKPMVFDPTHPEKLLDFAVGVSSSRPRVFHLHGSCKDPSTMVVTERDYQNTYLSDDPIMDSSRWA